MPQLGYFAKDRCASSDYCPEDGAEMSVDKREAHVSYGGGYYLHFLRCKRRHRWLLVITQYDESPPILLRGWNTKSEE